MKSYYIILILFIVCVQGVNAQVGIDSTTYSYIQANNPVANLSAVNFENYFAPSLTNAPNDAFINTSQFNLALAFPDGASVLRISAPVLTVAYPDSDNVVNTTNGLGDVNALLALNFVSKPDATIGFGPVISAPTETVEGLGTGKWQGGLAFVAFISKSPTFQYGGQISWQISFAGDEERPQTQLATIKPFYFWQLGKGTYLRGEPTWVFDIENETYKVPFALGIGKVVEAGMTVFNLFAEPQYTMLHTGVQPQFQFNLGINMQFKKN